MTKILKKVRLSAEQSTPMSADPTKGTQTNPYTELEMRMLQVNETWPGGYVEGVGYVTSYDMWDELYSISGLSPYMIIKIAQLLMTLTPFAAECFWHHVKRKGDMVLPDEEWENVKKIVGTIKPSENETYKIIENGVTYYAKHVSFYGTEFANALGTSIITFNSSGNPIGLYDLYDFNGTDRPFINQLLADIGAGITYILNGKDYIITKGSKYFDYVNGD